MITAFVIRFVLFTGVFYLTYIALFRHMSFFKTNRFLLLAIPMVSALIPILAPSFGNTLIPEALTFQLPEVMVQQQALAQSTQSNSINWIWITYLTITILFIVGLARGIIKGRAILKSATPDGPIYFSAKAESPFTFFKAIVIPTELKDNNGLPAIIKHEQVHVNQYHSWDNLYYGLLTGLSWFNPFMHLLAKELRQIHECLADEQALKNTSREEYARLLLSSAFGSEINLSPMAMGTANPFFNSSLIKTRITMIYKQKTQKHFKWLYLALVPLLAGMTLLSCNKAKEVKAMEEPVEQKTTKAMEFGKADSPPLFENCDANAEMDIQKKCFTEGLTNYIINNFKYPDKAYEEQLEGKIFLQFVINQEGSVQEVDVLRSTFPEDANREAVAEAQVYAVKFMAALPKMAPAMKDGKKVAVKLTLPLNLKLD